MNLGLPTSAQFKESFTKYVRIIAERRFIIIVLLVGSALAFTLIQTSSFINISRNEDRFNEEVLKINYKSLSTEVLKSFSQEEQDGKIEVNSNFDPNRQNPFSE